MAMTKNYPPAECSPARHQTLEYTWEVDEEAFTNWFGDTGAANRYKGSFSQDRNTEIGQWEGPGGVMKRP